MGRLVSAGCFGIFLVACSALFFSACSGDTVSRVEREKLFTLQYGRFEDEIDLFGLDSGSTGPDTRIYMQDGLFYIANSGSQKILDAMDKGTRVEQIHEAARRLKRARIRVGFFLQFGYPGETRAELVGLGILDALVKSTLASSKGDARRGIQGKGFLLNGEVPAPERTLAEGDLLHGKYVMLQKGKKSHALLIAE